MPSSSLARGEPRCFIVWQEEVGREGELGVLLWGGGGGSCEGGGEGKGATFTAHWEGQGRTPLSNIVLL